MDPEVRAWRVKERARSKEERQSLSADRALLTEAIARNLDTRSIAGLPDTGTLLADQGRVRSAQLGAKLSARKRCDAGVAGRGPRAGAARILALAAGRSDGTRLLGHHGAGAARGGNVPM